VSVAPRHPKPNYPALDGLRGIAVLGVFLAHYADIPVPGVWHHSPLWFGWVGVDLFFVLSGFLITGILFDSLGSARYFRNFYIRRTLRIFPLFYTVWAICLLITPFVHVAWNRYVVAMMFYVGNWTYQGAFAGTHPDPGILMIGGLPIIFGQFWTLCVEEQFYLLWPLVVYFVRRRESLLKVTIWGAALIPLLRCTLMLVTHLRISGLLYVSSFSRFDSLLVGSAVALWLRGRPAEFVPSPRYYAILFFAPAAILAALLATVGRHQHPLETNNVVFSTVGFTLLALSAAGAILASLDHRTRLHRYLRHRWLVKLGTISYGFYVLHAIPLRILYDRNLLGTEASPLAKVIVPVVAFVFFYGLSRCSYRWIESPFLKLKDKLAPPSARTDVRL